jgi:hypothetical protein
MNQKYPRPKSAAGIFPMLFGSMFCSLVSSRTGRKVQQSTPRGVENSIKIQLSEPPQFGATLRR